MDIPIRGLHHVTATVNEAQPDLDFYAGLLGLRLVKKTVNFDHTGVYHFYYGDEEGRPGSLMTTFPYGGEGVPRGRIGAGQISVTSFSVPPGALDFWRGRLADRKIPVEREGVRFEEGLLEVRDPSGLRIELREGPGDPRDPWVASGIPPAAAVRGLHSVTLTLHRAGPSLAFLTGLLGMKEGERDGDRIRVLAGDGRPGALLELEVDPEAPAGMNGLGTVHHVALEVDDGEAQRAVRAALVAEGVQVTQVKDRQYFTSIYFRGPGGILYEVATRSPGFTQDEALADLGTHLKLPGWEESNRRSIERKLTPVSLENVR